MTDLHSWDAWKSIHQPFELDWWKEAIPRGHLKDEDFIPFVQEIKDFVEPTGRVLDIGCGPRPFFPPCTVIEPLAEEYQKFSPPEWWQGVTVFNQPAEEPIPDQQFDTIICWNAIDHTIGWIEILNQIHNYCAPNARVAIATDFHPPFVGHPGFPRKVFMREIEKRFEIHKVKEPFGRALALLMTAR